MHEMALAESVLQLIEDAATAQHFSRVSTVWLEIGKLAAVEVDALRFCFDSVTVGSVAAGARLEIVMTPGAAWCARCREAVDFDDVGAACPLCGTYQLRVTGGTGMRVMELEVA